MSYLKKLYLSWCKRIYSVGRNEFEQSRRSQLNHHFTAGERSKLYDSAQIINLSGDKTKIRMGRNCHIYANLTVFPFEGSILIGDHCSIGETSRIVSGKKIEIGNRVMIAHNVNILDNNSHPKDAALRHEDFVSAYSSGMKEFDLEGKEIIIEDDVWIGFNSIILKGVRIGRGAIIGAGSVVVKDVEPWTINVGSPLRCVEKMNPLNF